MRTWLLFGYTAVALAASSCNSEHIAQLSTENEALTARLDEATAEKEALAAKLEETSRVRMLDAQQRCADQAARRFQIDGFDKERLTSFANHYNAALGKCFIEVNAQSVDPPGNMRWLIDAFEGKSYAQYSWFNTQGKKYWEVKPVFCSVTIASGEEVFCTSAEEFDQLIKPYMED